MFALNTIVTVTEQDSIIIQLLVGFHIHFFCLDEHITLIINFSSASLKFIFKSLPYIIFRHSSDIRMSLKIDASY